MHNDFTLFMRTYPNGKKVVFYHAYDENGKRVGPWTTNNVTLTAARNYCHRLLKAGTLIPNKNKTVTFGEYSAGFWERDSEYIRNQESRGDITENYISNCGKILANQILPFFADTPLDKFTDKAINDWVLGFKNRKIIKDGKTETVQYKNTYANTALGTLSVMLAEAVRRELINSNPCDKVRRLKKDTRKIEILTVEEVRKLFPDNWQTVWGDKEIAYIANRLASLTGMRAGEVMGLRGEFVFDDYIRVCGQYTYYGYGKTKTKENRNIPLMPEMTALLRGLMKQNGNGYVFSQDGGAKPLSQNSIRWALNNALQKIGINRAEIRRRGLSLHGWRHFLNTELQIQGLTIQQVQSVTGHKSERMSEWYSHLDARQIADVVKAQETISGKPKTEAVKPSKETAKGKKNPECLKIVKMHVRKTA